jgi:hypothetical protein
MVLTLEPFLGAQDLSNLRLRRWAIISDERGLSKYVVDLTNISCRTQKSWARDLVHGIRIYRIANIILDRWISYLHRKYLPMGRASQRAIER